MVVIIIFHTIFSLSFKAYGEENYETLRTMGEALERKDSSDTARWQEEM